LDDSIADTFVWTGKYDVPRNTRPVVAAVEEKVLLRRPVAVPNNQRSGIARILVLFAILLFSLVGWMAALDSGRRISQYSHTAWRIQDGVFNGPPIVIAQTADGYLWIGTHTGLLRFDGVRFVQWSPPPGKRLLDLRIFSLLGARDGSLWIGTGYGISRWKDRDLVNYSQLSGRIEAIIEGDEGAVWLARTQSTDGLGPLCSIKNERSHCYGASDGLPFPLAIRLEKGASGELWVGGYSELCRWKPGSCSTYFAKASQRPETFASLRGIATPADGSVWAAVDGPGAFLQLRHFEHESWVNQTFPRIAVNNSDITTLFADHDNALWVGTANHGIFCIRGEDVDHFGSTDGLSSDAVNRFFQDAEGTLWVVTSAGIDKFRDLQVATYSMREGLSAAGASSVLASRDGTVWIGNFGALNFLRNGKLSAVGTQQGLPALNVTTIFEDHAGLLWAGIGDGLWVYDGRTFRSVRHSDGSTLGIIFAITEDTHHNIWVRAGTNLDRIVDLKVQDEFTSPQISTAYTLAANPQGGLVLGLVNGDLVHFQDGTAQIFPANAPANAAANTRQIRDLLVESDGSVWGTTLDEVSRWKDGTRKNLTTRNGLPCDGIFAFVKDSRGSLWLYAQCGIIAIEKSELDRWWEHPDDLVKSTLFDAFDGAQPGLTSLKPQAAQSTDGRLWFVNGQILQALDPNHLQKNAVPPPIHVEQVLADRTIYSPKQNLQLPPLTRDLEIDYTALSFVVPQKVFFRYMLEGHDKGWQEPGARRQAFYNDLRPGHYRFRVAACNNSGVWNEAGTFLDFSIAPAYYQTGWFRAAWAAFMLLLLWAIYQFRLQQVHQQFNIGLEARVNERTRIARDLHDTLLQTLHGLMFQFQAVRNLMPRRPEEAMRSLDEAISETEKALTEGRNAIQGLRSEPIAKGDLAELLKATSQELSTSGPANPDSTKQDPPVFALFEEGERQTLSPATKNEICRIASEILRNAFRHAHAHRIEVEIRYDDRMLRLRIRDDGRGIDPKVLKDGASAGHFGLRGVRERAERIGAQLDFWSEAGAGTEVQLSVPAAVAYETSHESVGSKLFRKVRNRGQRS
jgi:signal transduction histidine kinase/ligand-binding sensor domain-containing protein